MDPGITTDDYIPSYLIFILSDFSSCLTDEQIAHFNIPRGRIMNNESIGSSTSNIGEIISGSFCHKYLAKPYWRYARTLEEI